MVEEMEADLACYLFSTEALGLASFLYMGESVRLHGSLRLASFLFILGRLVVLVLFNGRGDLSQLTCSARSAWRSVG